MTKSPGGPRQDVDKLLKHFASSPQAETIRALGRSFDESGDDQLAAYIRGELPDQQARRIRAAILVDSACARRVARLAGGGLPDQHLDVIPDPLVLLYFADAIPTGPLGDHLRDEIAARFAGSAAAERILDVVDWSTAEGGAEQREWLRWILTEAAAGKTGVVVAPAGRGLGRAARKGAARAAGDHVRAWLVDADDKLVLDADGRPVPVAFTVLAAQVDPRRGLFVRLLTDDTRLLGVTDPTPQVRLNLRHEGRVVQFPPVELRWDEDGTPYPSGSATIRATLGVDMDVARLPGEAFIVTVKTASPRGGAQ